MFVAWLRAALACALFSISFAASTQQQFGGPAPPPACRVHGWPQCIPEKYVTGIQAALQEHCDQYAAAHTARGGIVWCGQQGSVSTQCTLSTPAISPGFVGGNWANTNIVMAGQDTFSSNWGQGPVFETWGPRGYAGPACFCPANSGLTPEATCACPAGMNWDPQTQRCAVPPPDPVVITLSGRTHTRALPAGPPLTYEARVTRGGAPVPGSMVNIWVGQGNITGLTDADGIYRFTYIPPFQKETTEKFTATCIGCSNTAETGAVVTHCDVCEPGFGNPVQPATGEKQQSESDWIDEGAHALSLVRNYRSQGVPHIGLGAGWTHGFAGQTTMVADKMRTVQLGDGRTIVFEKLLTGSWFSSESRADTLIESGGGFVYTRAFDETRYRFEGSRLADITQRNGWTMSLSYDLAGNLVRVSNAFGRALQFTYAGSRLTGATAPDGSTVGYAYDAQGRLSGVTFPDGKTRQYHYEDTRFAAALTGITDENGQRYATFTYDAQGRATGTSHALGANSYSVTYQSPSPLAGSVVSGTNVSPDHFKLSAQVRDPNGNVQQYQWQGGDGTVRRTGASGPFEGESMASRGYGGSLLPVREVDFEGNVTTHTEDASRELRLSTTHAVGTPQERTTAIEWHPTFRLPVRVTEPGRVTATTYDASGNKLSETITDSASGQTRAWAWTYTAQGLVDTLTDPEGGTWRLGYDGAGNRTSVRDPLNRETRWTHDAAGRILTQTDPGGLVTSYSYDARGRLTGIQRAGEASAYGYNATGQLTSSTLPDGYQVTYAYDAAQRLTGATDNRGNTVSYTLDAAGNRTREEVKDASGAIAWATTRTINALSRLDAVQTASGRSTFGYDANGELVRQTDPLNQSTRQTLDSLRRLTATTFADNTSASQAWNQLDQLTGVTDPKGVSTQYVTNAFGEVTSETSPDIGTIRYTRDANGEVIQTEDAKGQISRIERDALGRVSRIEYTAGHQVFYSYDAAGAVGRIEDKSGVTAYERDALGRVTAKTQDVNDVPGTPSRFRLQYGYGQGRLEGITYPSGLKVSYQRSNGRITGIDVQEPSANVNRPKPVQPFLSNLTYTALDQPKAWTWFNGDSASRSFDLDGRMTATEFASYTFDAASRISGITQSLYARGTGTVYITPISWQAGYDTRNRLVGFGRSGSDTRYTYDANSNRLTAIDTATSDTDLDGEFDQTDFARSTSQALNIEATSNRLLGFTQTVTTTNKGNTRSVVISPIAYSLDANGALTSDGLRSFDYDASNRLAKVRVFKDGEAAGVSYLTNALGQRVFKSEPVAEQTLPSEETLGADFVTWLKKQFGWLFVKAAANTSIGTGFVFGDDNEIPSWAVLGEYDNGSAKGKGRTEYLWLPTEDGQAIPVGIYRNGKFFAIHPDHLGTPRLMTNEAKEVVWQWPYSAFGNNKPTGVLKATEKPKQAITNQPVLLKATNAVELNLRFPGQYADEETGSFYNYFRTYHPGHGRYTQSDPIGLAGGINSYAYVEGSPLSLVDPYGLFGWADMPTAPQWAEDFGGGLGDVLTFGISGAVREQFDIGSVNRCSGGYAAGEVAGMVASVATGFVGGTKAVAKASSPNNWANFSHSGTPASWNRGSRWSKTGNRGNGDYIPTTGTRPDLHDLMDATAAGVGGKYPTWPAWRRAPNRMPYTPGAALYGAASAAMNSCECRR
ncbi:hypothetical protein FN976_15015 [Caenimonas sedimenti]|uniref:RHS repeat protein n=1 Tax=Caenimonas sedimenti TaxID=2596921 RepID=A0A562ZPJ7_9BURK|nr:RHS repeat-associated core domain-containing protein [Caenimonas sedimenti]TWO70301.1 hypothetical protein FN976_15015 [Caenimonas sedimenti]